ncbi:MAG: tetratricopeptide repeat protein [Bacteroidales bacterium]|jgi:tetratricopeptide (TPR) repeat protein|nr:tetratricopeptide repeat protein [Bacteroidales bacterium]MDD4213551.1 tetratricopeptide repeat protein [Bacteroidales bacterium]
MKKVFFIAISIVLLCSCTSKHEKAIEFNKSGIRKMYSHSIEEAIKDFNKAIELDPLFDQPYYYRANLKFSTLDYQGAIADYNKAIEINPAFTDAYANRGNLYQSINEHEKACADWRKADELGKANMRDKLRFCR